MDKFKAWWTGLEPVRKIMVAAIALMFVSQFFTYRDNGGSAMLSGMMDTDHYTGMTMFIGPQGGTGWQLHPLALILLPALGFVYLSQVWRGPFWSKWGHWLALVMLFFCVSPMAPFRTLGGFLGLIAFGLTIWGTVRRFNERRSALPPPSDPPV